MSALDARVDALAEQFADDRRRNEEEHNRLLALAEATRADVSAIKVTLAALPCAQHGEDLATLKAHRTATDEDLAALKLRAARESGEWAVRVGWTGTMLTWVARLAVGGLLLALGALLKGCMV